MSYEMTIVLLINWSLVRIQAGVPIASCGGSDGKISPEESAPRGRVALPGRTVTENGPCH